MLFVLSIQDLILLLIPASCCCAVKRHQGMDQVVESLLSLQEMWVEFPVPGIDLVLPSALGAFGE